MCLNLFALFVLGLFWCRLLGTWTRYQRKLQGQKWTQDSQAGGSKLRRFQRLRGWHAIWGGTWRKWLCTCVWNRFLYVSLIAVIPAWTGAYFNFSACIGLIHVGIDSGKKSHQVVSFAAVAWVVTQHGLKDRTTGNVSDLCHPISERFWEVSCRFVTMKILYLIILREASRIEMTLGTAKSYIELSRYHWGKTSLLFTYWPWRVYYGHYWLLKIAPDLTSACRYIRSCHGYQAH